MWVFPATAVALLVVAAVADWHARRNGRTHRAGADYWHAVAEARKEARRRRSGDGRTFGG